MVLLWLNQIGCSELSWKSKMEPIYSERTVMTSSELTLASSHKMHTSESWGGVGEGSDE